MRLKTQLVVGAAILIVVLLGMAVFAVVMRVQVTGLRAQHDIAASMQDEANDLSYLAGNYLLYHEDAQKGRWETVFASFSRDLERLEVGGSLDESAVIDSIRANAARLQEVFADVAATAATGGSVTGTQAFLRVSWSRMEVQNRQIVFDATRLEDLLEHRVERANLVSTVTAFAMMGLFGLLLLAAYVLMYRRTIAGIAVLRAGTENVGRGDLQYSIPTDRRDEIGDLSRAFNAMTIDLKSVTASKAELEKEVEERRKAQAERERLLAKQEKLAESLAKANEGLQIQNEDLRVAEEKTAALLAERDSLLERLQTAFLDIPQELPGVRFGHLYRSATKEAQVGGDFYDVFAAKDQRIGLLVGDVAGRGIEAARIATLAKDTVHAFTHQFRHPHLVLRETNRLLAEKNLPGFVTAFLAFLDPETGELEFCSAGHPPPLLASGGESVLLESTGSPLGVFADARYSDKNALVPRGSLLVLYTDGLTEARRGELCFGEGGLRKSLARASRLDVEKLPGFLLSEALRHSRGQLDDDLAILAVSYLGPGPVTPG